ncbi:diaminopimelate decarboxylase [Sunxiuqinia elliptica]|uniref:Diaminopimelate decarboxylase n=1 Tax=Sunxiuqinia elliptica TaxID=655355 RepID=A0A4R6HAV2_9BACT|nr:diaminopimelate decarboxylase [Sunxiuqinia elliptica]TDO05068.1 diaminopimelate decarboxylase [Sunxiuqinia elliptica]TDO64617.1 diaminopimelate decarboxylase [Sunxiuqinia elliptica]
MREKKLPFDKEKLEQITEKHPTPFHIYDEKGMLDYAKKFTDAFSWNEGFKEYYAIKAAPNPFLMKLLRKQGFGIDCSSMAELLLAEKLGMRGEEIMFTSNDTPAYEFQKAKELGAIINLDDIKHIEYLEKHAGLPELVSFRYNPGTLKGGNIIIGNPEDSKYGFTREQLFEGYKILKEKGVKRFGIHTMVASNELDADYFIETAEIIFDVIVDIAKELDIRFEFANLGGGIGIPYKSEHKPVDLDRVSAGIKDLYEKLIVGNGLDPLKIFFESGRAITGPFGFLVSRVLHIKETYKKYAGLDSCMANLMRPALYGAYHHVTVMGKEGNPHKHLYDVTGSLCENNDKFAINRLLPEIEPEDLVVIHDTGAHGHSMGFNYNGKLRSAELLLRENGDVVEIRRAETMDDLFATLDFDAANQFE